MVKFTHRLLIAVVVILAIFFLSSWTGSLANTERSLYEEQILRLERRLDTLQAMIEVNTYADCVNENMLRQSFGVGPIDYQSCVIQHIEWYQNYLQPIEEPAGPKL